LDKPPRLADPCHIIYLGLRSATMCHPARLHPRLYAAFGLLTLLMVPSIALAKSVKTLGYGYDTIWSSSIRFLRADRGYTIKDKDKDNGFILFVYPGAGAVKECAASLELLRITDEGGQKKIRLQLSIQHQPSYIEVHLLDTLEEKLRDEQGAPPTRREKPKEGEKPKGDAKKKDNPPEDKSKAPEEST
jgi:hypothetical protein